MNFSLSRQVNSNSQSFCLSLLRAWDYRDGLSSTLDYKIDKLSTHLAMAFLDYESRPQRTLCISAFTGWWYGIHLGLCQGDKLDQGLLLWTQSQ